MGEVITMESLPRDLVSSVLLRLPARELLKCKLVCKSWLDLITDPNFVTSYYVQYNNLMHSQEEHRLIIRIPNDSRLETNISVLSWHVNDLKKIFSSTLLNLPREINTMNNDWSEIMGPCNGIYFVQSDPYVIMNPSLRQFKVLPESHFTTSSHDDAFYYLTDFAGFGFDTKTNDYKVVVIKDLWLMETDERQIRSRTAELYSLNSNSWRKLDVADLQLPVRIWEYSSRVYTFVNNCYHWFGFVDDFVYEYDDDSDDEYDEYECGVKEDAVLAFDMVVESFRKIKVPKLRYSSQEEFAALLPFNESATIGVIVYRVNGKFFDVWVLKDYWNEESWVKQYSVVRSIQKLVGFDGHNQFLWVDRSGKWVWYESESGKTSYLQVSRKDCLLRAARYMESLVSLQRGKEISHQCF